MIFGILQDNFLFIRADSVEFDNHFHIDIIFAVCYNMKMIIKFAEEVSVLNKKSQYNTRQLGELMDYLESVKGVHVTVGDICAHFRSIGKNIGTATVYRHLERMDDD